MILGFTGRRVTATVQAAWFLCRMLLDVQHLAVVLG